LPVLIAKIKTGFFMAGGIDRALFNAIIVKIELNN